MNLSSFIELLESRIAPAAVFKFTDIDGDAVTITTNKGTNADLAAIVTLVDEGIGKEVQRIDFSLNPGVFAGSNLTITAARSSGGGDGLVNVGFIDASTTDGGAGVDLGSVKIRGDLGRIEAGDASTGTTALKALSVQSMGEFGLTTQQAGGTLGSLLNGALGSLKVVGNMRDAAVATIALLDGRIGSVTVGGSVIAGGISGAGGLGMVKIGGNLEGGPVAGSGAISAIGKLAGITLGGSLIGGLIFESGVIVSTEAMGPVKIGGNVIGGDGFRTGRIGSDTSISSITIGGSLIGGSASQSGILSAEGKIGAIKIAGDVVGGDHDGAGEVSRTANIQAQAIAKLFIRGSIISGTNTGAGTLVDSGSVRVFDDLGAITIKGSLIGNSGTPVLITARGLAVPGATSDVAIKSLTVGGRVEFTDILAGYSVNSTPVGINADAQIGTVVVGDWIASNLVAGVQDDASPVRNAFFGDASDQAIAGGSATIISKIGSITIKGMARGTIGAGDHFGFVAQQISSFKIGGTKFPLTPGPSTDLAGLLAGATDDLRVREIL